MSLNKYIAESERRNAFMTTGDVFSVGVNEELCLEFDVVEHSDDSVVVEADDFGLKVLEHCGCQMIADEEDDKKELDEGKKPWFKDGVPMCSEECCGKPVMECTCGPDCAHCNCSELKKMMESRVHDEDMDRAHDYKRKASYHERMGNPDAASYYKKKYDEIMAKGLHINRAQESLEEDADDVADAIKRRIMNMDDFSEMVRKYGVDVIVTAIEDEAEFHSDSDELGSSDISAMVNSVMRSLERSKTNEAEYQGREVKLGKPTRGDVKKYKVYVKDPKTGNVKKVNFGDPNMEIRRDNPAARKNFRARHNCSDKKDRTKAGYWSCRMWSKKPVSKIV